jgi:transposase InsO family protein
MRMLLWRLATNKWRAGCAVRCKSGSERRGWEIVDYAQSLTLLPMKTGFLYLTAIIDVYSRYIVGWGISIYSPRVVLSYSKILIEVNSSLNYLSPGDQSKMDK